MCLLPRSHLVIKVGSTCQNRKAVFGLKLKKEPRLHQKSESKEQENELEVRLVRGREEEVKGSGADG